MLHLQQICSGNSLLSCDLPDPAVDATIPPKGILISYTQFNDFDKKPNGGSAVQVYGDAHAGDQQVRGGASVVWYGVATDAAGLASRDASQLPCRPGERRCRAPSPR